MMTTLPPPAHGNLPVALSSFVGRRRETAEVTRLLADFRLLTLTGPGGSGKTRLALQVATELQPEISDGVWLVEFAALTDEELVPQALAATLGVYERAGQPLTETLANHLCTQTIFLLFDNCEHLIEACARLSARLLASCPGIRILATSREPLGVPGEVVWVVPPLSLPATQPWSGPASGQVALDTYRQSEAVELFVDRARAASPFFTLTVENGPWVAEICRRLDGIPLAIELAAARVRAYSVRQIAENLDDRFRLLTSRLRTVPERHQTLEATLDWSHALLFPKEQMVVRRLSVFAPGWTLEAAVAIGAGDGIVAAEVMDVLSNLVDKSWVMVDHSPASRRYHYLETIRQYAHQKLFAAGEVDRLRDRHLDYFLQWAETNATRLYEAAQSEWLELFNAEHDNLRAALDWSYHSEGKRAINLRLAGACGRFWQSRGFFREGRERLEAALNAVDTSESSEARARALVWIAELAYAQSDLAVAGAMAKEGVALAREMDLAGRTILAWHLNILGRVATEMGDYSTAAEFLEEALPLYRQQGDLAGIANILMELGWTAMRGDDFQRAEVYLNESVPLSRQSGDIFLLGFALSALGELAIRQGRFDQANTLLEECLASRRILGDQWGTAIALGSLGWAALRQHDFSRAREMLGESLSIRMAIDDKGGVAWCLEKLAELLTLEAQALSAAHRRRGLEKAVRLLGAADNIRAPLNSVIDRADRPAYNHLLDSLRAALGIVAFDAQWSAGYLLPLREVVELALEGVVSAADAAAFTQAQAEKMKFGGLTARERDTVRLITQGKSNREIAAKMTVGEKTVETYITRIMNKLGFDSRVQIALWAVEKGLAEASE